MLPEEEVPVVVKRKHRRAAEKDSGFSDLSSFGCVLFPFDLHRRTWVEFGKTGSIVVNAVRLEGERKTFCVGYLVITSPSEPEHTVAALRLWSASAGPFLGQQQEQKQTVCESFRAVKWKSRM